MANNNNNNNNIHGYVAPGWNSVRSVFEQNLAEGLDIGASLCIYHRGQCVVDLYGGWKDIQRKKEPYTSDTLQLVFSVSKGIMAAAIALCVEKGWLDYDIPVAQYWPEFAANGKQNITVSDVLSHRAGLPYVDEQLTLDDVCNWSRMTSLLAAQKPHWEPGTIHGYHAVTSGFLGGELIRRVDPHHRPFGQFVRDEIDNEFYLGVPNDEIEARIAPLIKKINTNSTILPPMNSFTEKTLTCNGAFPIESQNMSDSVFNKPQLHRAEIPAANGITNARSLARIYARLIGDINENGQKKQRLISEKTLTRATTNVTPVGEPDRILFGIKSIFAMGGFHIYSDYFKAMGTGVFGHKGLGGSCAFGYPPQKLTFAHVCNHLDFSTPTLDPRTIRLLLAIENILNHKNNSSISFIHVKPTKTKQTN
ncbi:unnamed protein product [Rotaria sordida]|uniref:Beta-lactamase-related domain-containing protein n=1 Tax=Rotaria sordida TaxID=392033 RepID=A0A818STZ5_9BILA|nr:unnamed protein product [Rotaria sordida]CAF1156770.1 unnamed protein product [Rotaria sordida]CAF3650387.1 unnamed protein product [Rotaria sordida]CAF3667983.1 unnamed protein product [Rotaria sordida]